MAIAKSLPKIDSILMQKCPLCERMNRIVVKGICRNGNNLETYPDMGYSFCNCKAIFYTNYENVKIHTHFGFQHFEHPLKELKNIYDFSPSGKEMTFIMPDPFFCEWGNNPYTFEHWNIRFNHALFDMDQFCEDAKEIGFEVISAKRQFDVNSEDKKTMEIILRKP